MILGVSLSQIFFLRKIVFLSAIRESHLDWYTEEMRFQITSPIPLKSSKLLDLAESTCLLAMYLAMKLSESLMFLESEVICSIEPWSEIGWKLLSQRSGSIGVFRSYCNWILMTASSTWVDVVLGYLEETHYGVMVTMLLLVSATLLTQKAFSCIVLYNKVWELSSMLTSSLLYSILSW